MSDIKERLEALKILIQSSSFFNSKVNIKVFSYDIKDEMTVRYFISQFKADKAMCCQLVEYNLYQIFLSICNDKGIIQDISRVEAKKGKDYVFNQLRNIIREKDFVNKIVYEPHKKGDILLLTGVGSVFPFVKVTTLLDALQPNFSDIPILVMYLGKIYGEYFKLFDKLHPDLIYRAFDEV